MFGHILGEYSLTYALHTPYIGLVYGRYLQSIGSWNGHWNDGTNDGTNDAIAILRNAIFLRLPKNKNPISSDSIYECSTKNSGISAIFPIFRSLRRWPEKVVDGVANAVKMHHTVSAQVLNKTRDV